MSHFTIDWSELSLQVMITFGHFLWQGCAVAMLLVIVNATSSLVSGRARALRSYSRGELTPDGSRRSANLCYTMACFAFFALPVCVVATFGWVHLSRGPILLAANDPVESPVNSATIADIPALPLSHTNVPMLPPVETHATTEMPAAERLEAPSFAAPSPSWAERTQLFAPYLLVAYAIGVGLMLTRFGLSIIGSTRLRRTLQPITDSTLLRIIAEQSTRLGLKQVPFVALCQRVTVPVVVGILKPAILLPPALLCGLNPHQLAAILSHEMAHIRRYDLLVNLLQRIVEALLFFHPATWWISRRISNERENCCDDMAAATTGSLPYANALLQMAKLCLGNDHKRLTTLASLSATGSNPTQLGHRIRRLIGSEQSSRIGISRRAAALSLALIVGVSVSLVAWGQSRQAVDEQSEEESLSGIFTPEPLWQTKIAANEVASEESYVWSHISPVVVATDRMLSIGEDFDLQSGQHLDRPFARLPRTYEFGVTLDPVFRRKSSDRKFIVEVSSRAPGKTFSPHSFDLRVLRAVDGTQAGVTITVGGYFDGHTSDVDVETGGDFLLLGTGNEVRVYRTETGQVETTLPVKIKRIDAVAMSPDRKWLVVSDQNDLHFWRWRDQAPVKTIHAGRKIDSLAFTPDGQYLAEGPDVREDIQIRDMRTLEIVASLKDEVGSPLIVSSMDITPDGRYLVAHNEVSVDPTKLTIPHRVNVWDLKTRQPVFQIATGEWVRSVAFSDDGRMIVGEFSGAAHGTLLAAWKLPDDIVNHKVDSQSDAKDRLGDGIQWSRWGDQDGLLSGARMILPNEGLQPGQPMVVEYRLANVSTETKTLKCYLNNGMRFTSLGRGNRISGFGLGWDRDIVTLTMEPGDVFIDTEHLVSIDMTGLEPGSYQAALGSAFRYPDEAESNTTHEIPHRGSIAFDIVGESKVTLRELPKSDIHWGLPNAGLQLGARFTGDPKAFAVGSTVEADLFVANVSDQPIECAVVLPHPGDGWPFNVEDANGSTINLERRTPTSFFTPQRYVHLKLAPGEIALITDEGMHVSHSSIPADDDFEMSLPRVKFEVVGSENEAKQTWGYGDSNGVQGRLVSQGGGYSTIFQVTLLRPEIPAFRLEVDSGNVPFSVVGPVLLNASDNRAFEDRPSVNATAPVIADEPNVQTKAGPASEVAATTLLKETFRLSEHSRVASVGFRSDSPSVVSLAWDTAANRNGLRVTARTWNLATQELTEEIDLEWHSDWTRYADSLLLSQDGTRVVGLLNSEIMVWDVVSGKIVKRHDIPEEIRNDKNSLVSLSHLTGTLDLSRIAFGRSLSLGGAMPNAHAIVMDIDTGRVVQKVTMEARVHVQSLALSSDGKRMATVGSQYGASIWDVESGQLLLDFQNDNTNRKHPDLTVKVSVTQLVTGVGFSPSGESFAVSDMLGVKLVDTQTGKVQRVIDAPYRYYDANSQFVFSADGQLFALLGTYLEDNEPRTVSIWSAKSGERLRTLPIEATAAAFSADGKWFAAGESDLKEAMAIWQIREDKPANPAAQPRGEDDRRNMRTLQFKLVDGENGTPLQGLECKANISQQGVGFRRQSYKSNKEGIVEVEVAEGESPSIAEVPSGWFMSPPSVIAIEVDENGKPKHEQKTVDIEQPIVVKLWRGTEVDGRLLWPDKTPAAGVKLAAGVYISDQSWKQKLGMDLRMYSFDHGDWPNFSRSVVTDDAGRFRVTVPPKSSRWWFRIGTTALGFGPQTGVGEDEAVTQRLAKCVPLEIQYGGNSRSNIVTMPDDSGAGNEVLRTGDLLLETGVIVYGRVVDAEGNGLSHVHLTTTGPHGPHSGRKAISGEDGKFEFPAMRAGILTVHPDARLRDISKPLQQQVISRDVQAVFTDQSFTIITAYGPSEFTIRAVPHTEVVFEWVDRRADKTQPIAYYGAFRVRGYMPDDDGKPSTYWTGETERVERDGKSLLAVKIPTQLLKPELMLLADRRVTASYSDTTGVTSGPGIVQLGDITANITRTIFGDEPPEPKGEK